MTAQTMSGIEGRLMKRKRGNDVGIEWCDFAATAVKELFRSSKRHPPAPDPA
jgi:hypothetical protein